VSPLRERVAATILLAASLAAIVEAHKLAVGSPGRPGPGFFPFYLAVALALVALVLVLQSLRARAPGPAASPPEVASAGDAQTRPRRAKVVLTLAAGLAYAFAFEPLGFALTTFVFLLFLLTVIEPQRPIVSLSTSAATALGAWLLFRVLLAVPLPAGPWGF